MVEKTAMRSVALTVQWRAAQSVWRWVACLVELMAGLRVYRSAEHLVGDLADPMVVMLVVKTAGRMASWMAAYWERNSADHLAASLAAKKGY